MELGDLLQSFGLCHMFPGRVQRQNIFSVFSKDQENTQCSSRRLHDSEFVQKIVYFNGDCRKVRAGTRKPYLHPLDISTVVFLCCDFIARQDLILHFWGCKLAFPLVVKTEQLEPPVLYIWPMKSLIAKCYAPGSGDTIETPVLDFEMKVVSALRFEEQTVSKSNISNMIISKYGKEHSYFFHRDLEGSVKQLSEVCNGMIEACPVFGTDDSPSLYLNLRGNCTNHLDQFRFVLAVSDVVILVCNRNEVSQIKSFVENEISIHNKMLITFFSDLSVSEEDIILVEDLATFCNRRSVTNLIVALKGVMRFDWMKDVLYAITNNKSKHSVDDLMAIARENFLDIDIDRIKQARRKAEVFSNKIIQHYNKQQITCIFPIQGSESLEWCKNDLEIYKLHHWKKDENVRLYRDSLEIQKTQLRSKQLHLIQSGRSYITNTFIENLETSLNKGGSLEETKSCSFINADEQNEIYIRSLKLELENATRANQDRLLKRYSVLVSKLNVDKLHTVDIQHTLDELDLLISTYSLSISDFTREMGQTYETIVSQCQDDRSITLERLNSIAVKLLLFGYQVEIMDGRSNYVPINWVKGILSELRRSLGNIRMKVVSVLGVQSTGKSTLLNIMFGSQFAEGSGRCTRGAFIHLVKVSPDCFERFRAEYLLVVDTEGLFALSSEVDSDKIDRKDRELATFVIGISNITIVNIMGENLSYLKDILPISVHAFLRMDLVGLNPHCVLLHQNVARGNRDQLLQQTYNLENVLDDYTSAACNLENVTRKRFKDVIKFDIAKDVYYFPPLYQSSDAQDIINPQFSEAVENLKMAIMATTEGTATIEDFTQQIGYIWEAVKRDNFVFEFKNTIEAKAGAVIDREICRVQWKLRSLFQEKTSAFVSHVTDCTDVDTLLQVRSEKYDKTSALTADLLEKSCSDIFHKLPSTLIRQSASKYKTLIKDSVERSIHEDRNIFENQFETETKKRQREIQIIKGDKKTWCEIDNFIDTGLKKEMTVSSDVDELSDRLFRRWMDASQIENDKFCNSFPEEDATYCIYLFFPTRHVKVNEKLEEKCITNRNMTDLLKNIPLTYWSFGDCQMEQKMANDIVSEMMEFLKGMMEKLQSGEIKYGVGVYKDIILQVRNHPLISQGLLHAKPVFEIDMALSLCGEFIQRMKKLEIKHVRIDTPFTKRIHSYFKSRVRESLCCQTDVNEIVSNFSGTISTELSHYIVSSLPQECANFMNRQYRFLSSKQALISYIYVTLLKSNDIPSFLSLCLNSFELSARCCIARLFDSISGIETDSKIGLLRNVIEEYVERNISFVCARLSENITTQDTTSHTVKQCVSIITSALGQFLPMNNIKPFENDQIEETDPGVVITMLVNKMNKESVRRNLVKKITYQMMETDEYDIIKSDTVQIITSTLIGCTESCPLCGEVCCIGQVNHTGKHRSFMHRPIGLNGHCVASSNNLSSLTCWDELNATDHDAVQQLRENWSISSDISTDDNSFWKYIFVTYIKEIANRLGKERPTYIPRSWYDLTRLAEIQKLTLD